MYKQLDKADVEATNLRAKLDEVIAANEQLNS
jgi:hypothetical protein